MNLIEAAQRNDIESVKAIVAGGGVDVNAGDEYGCTALSLVAKKGFVDCVKLLLDAKADVNKANHFGITPLHWASYSGYLDCVKVGCVVR
jgi:ankyrin repeat protein